jgi:hypothetical protein
VVLVAKAIDCVEKSLLLVQSESQSQYHQCEVDWRCRW